MRKAKRKIPLRFAKKHLVKAIFLLAALFVKLRLRLVYEGHLRTKYSLTWTGHFRGNKVKNRLVKIIKPEKFSRYSGV